VYSLEKDFYLGALGSFDYVFTLFLFALVGTIYFSVGALFNVVLVFNVGVFSATIFFSVPIFLSGAIFFKVVVFNVGVFSVIVFSGVAFFNVIVYNALLFLVLLFSFVTMPPLLPHAYKFNYLFSSRNSKVGGLLIILASDKKFSFHGLDLASSPFLFSSCKFNPSNVDHTKDVFMSLNGSSPNPEDNMPIPSKVGIKK
jgi:hypothetical protein